MEVKEIVRSFVKDEIDREDLVIALAELFESEDGVSEEDIIEKVYDVVKRICLQKWQIKNILEKR